MIVRIEKYCLAVIASLDDMMRLMRHYKTRKTSHIGIVKDNKDCD